MTEETDAVETEDKAAESAEQQSGALLTKGESDDWMPEKFRVMGEDGALDTTESAKKLTESYKNLEQRLGSGEAPPKSPDDYDVQLDSEGWNWDEFKSDPSMQGFMKTAHAKGINNEQMQFILGQYWEKAPGLVDAGKQLTQDEGAAELRKFWQSEEDYRTNLTNAGKAFNAFVPDDADTSHLENDPTFIRIMSAVAKEMGEDHPVMGQPISEEDFTTQIASLNKKLEEMDENDPQRSHVLAQKSKLYQRSRT